MKLIFFFNSITFEKVYKKRWVINSPILKQYMIKATKTSR